MAMTNDTETQSQFSWRRAAASAALCLALGAGFASAQETPYFITYDHHMEEPGSIELSIEPVLGTPKQGQRAMASNLEIEYGATGWWTTSLYLDGAARR